MLDYELRMLFRVASRERKVAQLRHWIFKNQAFCEDCQIGGEVKFCSVWNPLIPLKQLAEFVKCAVTAEVIVIKADTVEQVLAKCPEFPIRPNLDVF